MYLLVQIAAITQNLAKVGCHGESYGVHYVREYTMKDNCPTSMRSYGSN